MKLNLCFSFIPSRKSKKASQAEQHLQSVVDLLRHKDESLAQIAVSASSRKRKLDGEPSTARVGEDGAAQSPKKRKNQNQELAEREERAMQMLTDFMKEHGSSKEKVKGFTARVTRKASGKYDTNYFNEAGRRFRSMMEVGRHFGLVEKAKPIKRITNKTQDAEKKKVRKELEKLRKSLQRAQKSLDEFNADKPTNQLIEDRLLPPKPHRCAGAHKCDIRGFPGIPDFCIPDVLMSWDFLCTFQRALSLSPISLDDFCSALAFTPSASDDFGSVPVFVAETHLSLLKLILNDKSSEDWWYSVLETDEIAEEENQVTEANDNAKPIIKIDISALLGEFEDPLITTSWLQSLEKRDSESDLKSTVKAALKVMTNKYAKAYLRRVIEKRKSLGPKVSYRAVMWLVSTVREARPDLVDRSISQESLQQKKASVIEEVTKIMETLPSSVLSVITEDVISDDEDDDESDEESDDEGIPSVALKDTTHESKEAASSIPPKPLPTLVDLLLPPLKPDGVAEFLNPFTWSQMVGASAFRIVHRKKRALNEIDDRMREDNGLPPLSVAERRERERAVCSRILTESVTAKDSDVNMEESIAFLCKGGDYTSLNFAQRISLLRLLIEAAYDSGSVYEVVDSNYKQRTSAMKSLEQEERKAKKDAKEKSAADEVAARQKLADEAREKFFDEKRDEIRKLNEQSQQLSEDVLEALTDEDILDFDEDYKADFDSLPLPDSFSKMEVAYMVNRMKEEEAFDAEPIKVLSLEQIVYMEKHELQNQEERLASLGGEEALQRGEVDRSTTSTINSLIKEIEKLRALQEKLPDQRQKAIDQLKDAMEDGTIKVLRNAVATAKRAKLLGADDETGGKWVLDLLRDASLELELAKQSKKVIDAQKDLVAKRNKCFIRSEPVGYDRHGNRFWEFSESEQGRFWVETEFILTSSERGQEEYPGFTPLLRNAVDIETSAYDMEKDMIAHQEDEAAFFNFSRYEHHSSGKLCSVPQNHWGCLANEQTIRAVIKSLDSKGAHESSLKTHLKETLEQIAGEKQENEKTDEDQINTNQDEVSDSTESSSGDEEIFKAVKANFAASEDSELYVHVTSAIGKSVRTRTVVSQGRDFEVARYENGQVLAWKIRREVQEVYRDVESDDEDFEPVLKTVETPVWKVVTDRQTVHFLEGNEVLESIIRAEKYSNDKNYREDDSSYLSYRNSLGKFCGRPTEAAYASTPLLLARLILRREGELYAKLKIRSYDNNWGGKSGNRAKWTNAMRDFTYDISSVKHGLLTLENAFFELTGEFDDYPNVDDSRALPDAETILNDAKTRNQIELESYEKVQGLWNSPESRSVFIYIVSNCSTVGMLALSFDLLCRNTTKYLRVHKLLNARTVEEDFGGTIEPIASRRSRRPNAWQSMPEDWF